MAIDTLNKRSSAIHVGLPWRGMFPAPDGTIDQGDRQALAWVYSGVLASEQADPTTPITIVCGYYIPGAVHAQGYAPGAVKAGSYAPGAVKMQGKQA